MRFGKHETSRRLTGLTLPTVLGTGGGGATWEHDDSDTERARQALQRFEDRRVLYNPFEVELPAQCVQSVAEIREYLRHAIEQCSSAELRDPLRAIQAACRQFLTESQAAGEWHGYIVDIHDGGTPSWLFNQALGAFRARVGMSIAVIVANFDLDIDEHLVKILPPAVDE